MAIVGRSSISLGTTHNSRRRARPGRARTAGQLTPLIGHYFRPVKSSSPRGPRFVTAGRVGGVGGHTRSWRALAAERGAARVPNGHARRFGGGCIGTLQRKPEVLPGPARGPVWDASGGQAETRLPGAPAVKVYVIADYGKPESRPTTGIRCDKGVIRSAVARG